MHQILIDGQWRTARSSGTFQAVNPASGQPLADKYPVSTFEDIEEALQAASLLRFAALQRYDSVKPNRLPPELKDINPTGNMWRWIDGQWTKKDI